MFNAHLVAALPDGCSSLHQECNKFFPPSTEPKFARIWTKETFNAQLVAAFPDGCSSLHQEGVDMVPQVLNQNQTRARFTQNDRVSRNISGLKCGIRRTIPKFFRSQKSTWCGYISHAQAKSFLRILVPYPPPNIPGLNRMRSLNICDLQFNKKLPMQIERQRFFQAALVAGIWNICQAGDISHVNFSKTGCQIDLWEHAALSRSVLSCLSSTTLW